MKKLSISKEHRALIESVVRESIKFRGNEELIDIFGTGIKMWKSDYEHAAQYNGQLRCPSTLKTERKIVFQMYAEGYEKVEKWYRKRLCLRVIRRTIRRAVPRPLKNVIKKILGQ